LRLRRYVGETMAIRSIVMVAGARPNFMKIAPVHKALVARGLNVKLVHTGQHYDRNMSELFFDELGIPRPDVNLGVGSGSHAEQTADIMRGFEPLLERERPDLVLVVGDVNSTAACSLVTKKMHGVLLGHVEAGLRSFDRTMPEEVNRIVTDGLSDMLFTSERSGDENLRAEGVPAERVIFVGNVMIDTLLAHRERARATRAIEARGLTAGRYVPLTLHRPSNVDDPAVFEPLMDAVAKISQKLPVVFPVHPRARKALDRWPGLAAASNNGLKLDQPLGYLEFLDLMSQAAFVVTDSGGIQEETTVLGVPCITVRENTERPVTLTEGTNTLVGASPERLLSEARRLLDGERKPGRVPEGWDGHAAERIADAIVGWELPPR